jgi:hypothetical protein
MALCYQAVAVRNEIAGEILLWWLIYSRGGKWRRS